MIISFGMGRIEGEFLFLGVLFVFNAFFSMFCLVWFGLLPVLSVGDRNWVLGVWC